MAASTSTAAEEPRLSADIVGRTLFVWVTITALAVAAPIHTPLPLIGILLILYVVAATLWVRGQYAASLTPAGVWTAPLPVATAMVVLGLVVVGCHFLLQLVGAHHDWVLIIGIVTVFLGLGYLTTRGRQAETARAGRLAGAWLAVAGVLALGGLLLLGRGQVWLGVAALAIGLLLAPVGISLASEHTVGWLGTEDGGRQGRALLWVGAVLLVACTGVAMARVGSFWMLLAFVVVALGVVAVASSTQADIAIILAVVALMGVTPVQEPAPDLGDLAGRSRVLVVLGDSYISGEGAEVYLAGTDGNNTVDGEPNHCRRAPTSWAWLAGNQAPFDGALFLACSGARTYNVLPESGSGSGDAVRPRAQSGEPGTQLDQYLELSAQAGAGGFTPAMVVISLGGNDAGFSTIGMTCLAPGDCGERAELWIPNLDRVEGQLRSTFAEVRETFPEVPVVVTAYPDPIDNSSRRDCDQVALSAGDRAFVSEFLDALNGRVALAAGQEGFYFLAGMERALADADLQLCDPANGGRPGLNFIGLRSVGGIAEQRFNPTNWIHNSLHPNARGHAAMLTAFEHWLGENPDLQARNPEAVATDPSARVESVGDQTANPPCSLGAVTGGEPSCRDEGTRWALQQVSAALLLPGLWALLFLGGAIGAWLVAVVLFARHRRLRT